ncbi:MAG TPA: phasin family protein [Bauldia sp.]|nr:phasin family protein [Bauldia sp.]
MQRTPFEIPEQMREVADRSVEQARKAIEQYLEATQKAVAKAEGSARSVREGAAEAGRQALAFVEDNVSATFDFAHRLVQARTVEEIAALQKEFLQKQMASLTEQGKSLGEIMGRAATDALDKTKK